MEVRFTVSGSVLVVGSFLATTLVHGQGPAAFVAKDIDCISAAIRPAVEIDFEALPARGSSCPFRHESRIENPLALSGAVFTDPHCLRSGFCSSPTCPRDPDQPLDGNIVLSLNPGAAIDLPPGTGAAVLDIAGVGSNPFTLRAVDVSGRSSELRAEGIPFASVHPVFTSPVGLSRIEVIDTGGTGGPLGLAAVLLSRDPAEEPFLGCEDSPLEPPVKLLPVVSGTVRFLPEFGILDAAVGCQEIQSNYGRTTEDNREFRRGFFEFAIPDFPGEVLEATLFVNEYRGWTSYPMPPDVHELAYYPADLAVNTGDFDRPAHRIAALETDANLPTASFSIRVTEAVRRFQGKNLGFRIRLDADPDLEGFGWRGSGFGSAITNSPWLEIRMDDRAFRRGDVDGDGNGDLSDVVGLLGFLFSDGGTPPCEKSADIDDSGLLDVSDAVYGLLYMLVGGPAPAEPFRACGSDGTGDELSCASFALCR